MENIKENLFYSEKENTLFYIAGYTDQSEKIADIMTVLNEGAAKLAEIASIDTTEICTTFVLSSQRYQYMRVFYVKTDTPPEEAFKFGNDWTMDKWLKG